MINPLQVQKLLNLNDTSPEIGYAYAPYFKGLEDSEF